MSDIMQYVKDAWNKVGNDPKCTSLLKNAMSEKLLVELASLKTKNGATVKDCIQSLIENPDSSVGLYAPDAESYDVFTKLFEPVIKAYHGSTSQPAKDFGNVEGLEKEFPDLDPSGKYIISTRVRIGRSIKGYPFAPIISKEQVLDLESKVHKALSGLPGDLAGTYYPLQGMKPDVEAQLRDDHFLFQKEDRFLMSAGGYRNWPCGRGIFYNKNKTFLVWLNEEDHMRIISMQKGGNLGQIYKRLVTAANKIEESLPFYHHDKYGFLTFCPTNLGTTIRASVHIKLPLISQDPNFKKMCSDMHLQVRGTFGEHTETKGGVVDISNKRRLGLTEHEAVKQMFDGIKVLIKKEMDLEKNEMDYCSEF